MTVQRSTGPSTWADVGLSNDLGYFSSRDIDIRVVAGAAGKIELYTDRVFRGSFVGDTTAYAGISYLKFGLGGDKVWSQILVTNFITINHTVRSRFAAAQGSHADWDGTFDKVSEAVYDDSTIVTTNAAEARSTYTSPNVSAIPAGNVVKGVAVSLAARTGTDGPQAIRASLRMSGVDHDAPVNRAGLNNGFSGASQTWMKNPVTGLPWGNDEVNVEFGVVSQAS